MNPENSKTPRQLARQRYELKHPFADRYKANPEYFRKRARDAKRAARKFVDAAELNACIEDIRKAKTIRGDEWIVCLGRRNQRCGRMLQALRATGVGAHLIEHGFSDCDEYRDHWEYNRSTSLTCNAKSAKARVRAKTEGHLRPEAGAGYLRPPAKGSVPSKEALLNSRDSQIGKRNQKSSKLGNDAAIVRPWLLEKKSTEDIAASVGLSESAVHKALGRIFRLSVTRHAMVAHGEILTRAFPDQLSRRFNFSKKQIMRKCELAIHQIQFANRSSERALDPVPAGALLEAERKLLGAVIGLGNNGPGYFRSTVPQLDFLYDQAKHAIRALREAPDLEALINELCDQSRKALPGEACPARTILCLLPALVPLLNTHSGKPFVLAQQFLAEDFGVSGSLVEIALKPQKTQLPSLKSVGDLLRLSIANTSAAGQPAAQKRKPDGRGRKHGSVLKDTKRKIRLAAAMMRLDWTKYAMARVLYPNSSQHSAEVATSLLLKRHTALIQREQSSMTEVAARAIIPPKSSS